MNGLAAMVAVICAVLAALAFAVAAGDRAMLVPPPESVSESFIRQLASGRYDRALPFLSRHAAASADLARLETLATELEQEVGGIEQVSAELLGMKSDLAEARASVRGGAQTEAGITFALVREQGLWKIDGWSR